jgi:hypothetical protein
MPPAANVAKPDLDQKRPAATFSNPASANDVSGTSNLLNVTRNRKSPRAAGGMPSVGDQASPLQLDGVSDIIGESGLGGKPKSFGERLSDADEPTQTVTTDGNGSTHHRRNPSGSVTHSPIGATGTGSYGATAPDVFGGG